MIHISFLQGEAFFAAAWLAVRLLVWLRRGRIDWGREAALLLLAINLAVILRFAFYPFSTVHGKIQPLLLDPAAIWPPRLNLVPFVHIRDFHYKRHMLQNVLGNIAMFIPSGILLPLLFRKLDSFWKVTAAGAGLSLTVEILQLPFAARTSDVDDLILNTLGCTLGYLLFVLIQRAGRRKLKRQ